MSNVFVDGSNIPLFVDVKSMMVDGASVVLFILEFQKLVTVMLKSLKPSQRKYCPLQAASVLCHGYDVPWCVGGEAGLAPDAGPAWVSL